MDPLYSIRIEWQAIMVIGINWSLLVSSDGLVEAFQLRRESGITHWPHPFKDGDGAAPGSGRFR